MSIIAFKATVCDGQRFAGQPEPDHSSFGYEVNLLVSWERILNKLYQAIASLNASLFRLSFCEELMNEQKQSIVVPHLPAITDGLIQMITQNAANQVGSLTMETLVTVLGVDEKFVATIEPKVAPLAIALFLKNTNGERSV